MKAVHETLVVAEETLLRADAVRLAAFHALEKAREAVSLKAIGVVDWKSPARRVLLPLMAKQSAFLAETINNSLVAFNYITVYIISTISNLTY